MFKERPRRIRRNDGFAAPRGHASTYGLIFFACVLIAAIVQLTMAP